MTANELAECATCVSVSISQEVERQKINNEKSTRTHRQQPGKTLLHRSVCRADFFRSSETLRYAL